MIKAEDIKDRETLEQWLTDWPAAQGMDDDAAQQVAVQIALRASLRVLPIALEWFTGPAARKRDVTAAPILWCAAISAGANTCPPAEIGKLTSAALSAFSAYSTARFSADFSADSAAYSAANSAFSAARSVHSAARSASSAALWEAVRADAIAVTQGQPNTTQPLWTDPAPDWFQTAETAFHSTFRAEAPTYDFWLRWWDAAKAGTPFPWELMFEIALIPEEDWETGPERIAELIAEIEERHKRLAQVQSLKSQLIQSRATYASAVQGSHNHPPPNWSKKNGKPCRR